MRRTLLVAGIWLLLTVVSTATAWACTCATRDPRGALKAADAAFVGTLVTRDEPQPDANGLVSSAHLVAFRFTVERWVKGDHGPEVTVHSAAYGASCGIEATPGGRPVGLLLTRDSEGRWRSGLCSQLSPEALLDAARFPVVPAAVATGLLALVATAARRSVRRSGWTAAHNALR